MNKRQFNKTIKYGINCKRMYRDGEYSSCGAYDGFVACPCKSYMPFDSHNELDKIHRLNNKYRKINEPYKGKWRKKGGR